jgi:aminoglycoside phosphotransferase (APT) family kinase protein
VAIECIAFLVQLHRTGGEALHASGAGSCVANAELIAERDKGTVAKGLVGLARNLEDELACVPRGFAHGDFWSGNLLVANDRLSGVVDWAAAGPGRLPLLDLFHLHVSARRRRAGSSLGGALLAYSAERTADEESDLCAYGEAIELQVESRLMHGLLAAYWLEAVAREIIDPDRPRDPAYYARWRRENVDDVLDTLTRIAPRLFYDGGVMARKPGHERGRDRMTAGTPLD